MRLAMGRVRWGLVGCVGSVAVLCILLFAHGQSPTLGDYAEWTFHGVLLRDVLRGHADAGYVLKNYPVPNSLTTLGLGVLMLMMPWSVAAKVWLIGEVALGVVAGVQLQKASGKTQGWKLLVLPAAMLMGIGFWDGFTNFMLGTYLAMLLCALVLRGTASRWIYGVVLLASFFSHMIPFGFAVLVLGLYAMQERRWRMIWQAVPSLGLCAWYLVGRVMHGDADGKAGMVSSVPYFSPMFAVFKLNSYLKCWGFINPALNGHDSVLLRLAGAKLFWILFLLNGVIAFGLAVLMGREAWSAVRCKTRQRFIWLALAVFCTVAALLPGAAAGISDPGGRMIQIVAWCGLCLVATKRRWAGGVLGGCAVVLLSVDLWLLGAVAMKPPMPGEVAGPMPASVRVFAHVYYADRWGDYGVIDSGRRDIEIYPTAMFLRR